MLPQAIFWGYTRDVMPTFTPNEYFWQHHWDGKEEKWVAYARAIQKIIAKQGGMVATEHTMEQKLEYKAMVLGRKYKPRTKEE